MACDSCDATKSIGSRNKQFTATKKQASKQAKHHYFVLRFVASTLISSSVLFLAVLFFSPYPALLLLLLHCFVSITHSPTQP